MNEKEKTYRLLQKLSEQNDYVIVHGQEIKVLLDDLRAMIDTLKEVQAYMEAE